MVPPSNTCTVTFTDAHSHTLVYGQIPCGNTTDMGKKADGLRNVLNEAADKADMLLSAFVSGDTLTVAITQP